VNSKLVSIASIEVRFYNELLQRLSLKDEIKTDQLDHAGWDENKAKIAAVFKTRTRAEWCELLEGTDVCFAPVLDFEEAMEHPHNKAREVFVEVAGIRQPAPAPRFSRTKAVVSRPPPQPGEHTEEVLSLWGVSRG
jgi:alpha-methylacyl-CoA racemase